MTNIASAMMRTVRVTANRISQGKAETGKPKAFSLQTRAPSTAARCAWLSTENDALPAKDETRHPKHAAAADPEIWCSSPEDRIHRLAGKCAAAKPSRSGTC